MPNTHTTLTSLFEDIADSIRGKTGDSADIVADDFPEAIDEIPTGGGGEESSVFFLDYDGTIIETWDASSVASKTALPNNPTHQGLVAQGWNWDLQHIKDYIAAYDNSRVYVGQMYKTASGLTEIDVVMNKVTGKTITCNMVGNKNWGDGTTDNLTTHIYADYGEYTITCDGTTIPSGSETSGGMFSSSEDNINRYWCSAIRLGERVTSIGDYAFVYCRALTNITIPQGITSIGDYAFQVCVSLKNITIPQGVTSIGDYAFQVCLSLTNITIPQGITSIGDKAFNGCYALTNITIPQGVTIIGDYAFYYCVALTNITIPQGVTSIDDKAFGCCYALKNITIPQGVTSIGLEAFDTCYALKNITIPQGVTSIGARAFQSCSSLTNITIPQGITSIDDFAFSGCFSLTNITIPQGVTRIGDYAFQDCRALTNITIPQGVTIIGDYAFAYCYSIKAYDFTSVTTIPTLSDTNVFIDINSQCKILVPPSLYFDWIASTNWSTYADNIYTPVTFTTVKSLSIIADDCPGRSTRTTVHYTAVWNTEEGIEVTENGDALSNSFPQNTSTTDPVQRTVTFTHGGLTASDTITQGVWVDASYTLEEVGNYPFTELSQTISNPDSTLYDGVYQSTNKGKDNSQSVVKISFIGYENFTVYIRSYAESSYDYTIASILDADSYPTAYNDQMALASTKGNQTSATGISGYTKVEYPNDGGEHFIYIVFRKDGSSASNDDRGYFLIEK